MAEIFDFSARDIHGEEVPLDRYRDKVLLIVNTASRCGFTPQYHGLEQLHRDLQGRGLAVLAFPCNQFGRQEPGDASEIGEFCELNFGVSFPLFEKLEVNGKRAHPLFRYLKEQAPGILGSKRIKWNFTKFLVDREGRIVKRFAPNDRPEVIRGEIEKLL